MNFSEFAKRLYPIIGTGNSQQSFAKTLFETIATEEGQEILKTISLNTYKAYFNGHTGISKVAKKITGFLDKYEFEQYIEEQFSDLAKTELCEMFSDIFPTANEANIHERLADLFVEIIRDAASITAYSSANSDLKLNAELSELLRRLYQLTVDFRTSLKYADQDKLLETISAITKKLEALYFFYEKNLVEAEGLAFLAYNICTSWNKFVPHYNAFSNSQDKMSEMAQKEAMIAERLFLDFVNLILSSMQIIGP